MVETSEDLTNLYKTSGDVQDFAVGRKEEKNVSSPLPASLLQVAPLPSTSVSVGFIVLQFALLLPVLGALAAKKATNLMIS